MDTKKGQLNIISDVRLIVALLSLCGFSVLFVIVSTLVLQLMGLNPNRDPVHLASITKVFSDLQIGSLIVGFAFAIIGIMKIYKLRKFELPKIQLSKPFSRIFTIIGIFIGLLLVLFFLSSSPTNINSDSMEMYSIVSFYSKIFVLFTLTWYSVTFWLRKKGSVYSVSTTTSFSLFSLICLFPFGFIVLFAWLFFRGSEVSNLKNLCRLKKINKDLR